MKKKNLTALDYLTITFSLNLISEILRNCGKLMPLHANFQKLAGAQVHRGTAVEDDENYGAEFTEHHRALILTHANREKSLKNAILRAEMVEKIYRDVCGHERPLQWGTPESVDREQKNWRSLCSSSQKRFTQSALANLAPFFGGEKLLDEILYDFLCAVLTEIFDNRWSLRQRQGKKFFYSNWCDLLIDDMPAGLIAYDVENGGAMISISGSGCVATDFSRVHALLTRDDMSIFRPKISRVDIALDDLGGQIFNYESCKNLALEGMFTPERGAAPRYSCIESGHVVLGRFNRITRELEPHLKLDFFPDRGCSLYIGSRDAGKLVRVYEKGRQMKSEEFPLHVRFELEVRAIDRVLPFEILIYPDRFFAGSSRAAEKCLNDIAAATESETAEPVAIRTFREKIHAGAEHVKKFAALQAARAVVWMREIEEMSDKQIVDFLVSRLADKADSERIPKRLALPLPHAYPFCASTAVPYADLPLRGPEPKNRPEAGDTNPILNETTNLNDFLATVA